MKCSENDTIVDQFRNTELGLQLISPQLRSQWSVKPVRGLMAGYALRDYEMKRSTDSQIIEPTGYSPDVKRVGAFAVRSIGLFFIDDNQQDVIVLKWWEGVKSIRNVMFTHPTILKTTGVMDGNIKGFLTEKIEQKFELLPNNKWLYKTNLTPNSELSFGYWFRLSGVLNDKDANHIFGSTTLLPTAKHVILVSASSTHMNREPTSFSAILDDFGLPLLMDKINSDRDFIANIERLGYADFLLPWLELSRAKRLNEGDFNLPKELSAALNNLLNHEKLISANRNAFICEYKEPNPLTYQCVIFANH